MESVEYKQETTKNRFVKIRTKLVFYNAILTSNDITIQNTVCRKGSQRRHDDTNYLNKTSFHFNISLLNTVYTIYTFHECLNRRRKQKAKMKLNEKSKQDLRDDGTA